jgi:hypothetical protein
MGYAIRACLCQGHNVIVTSAHESEDGIENRTSFVRASREFLDLYDIGLFAPLLGSNDKAIESLLVAHGVPWNMVYHGGRRKLGPTDKRILI